jgi:DNA-binding NarL/FixJ family response regulator
LVEIVAEPGMGKSSLLAVLGRQLGDRPVLRARATEFEQAMPCAIIAKALASVGRNGQVETVVRQLVGVDAGTVGIPRHETYRATRRMLTGFADPSGVAVLLDDAHWADGDSLALLEYLLSTMPTVAMLVAVSYRPRQAPIRLIGALAAPEVAAWRVRVEPAPLDATDSVALLNAIGCARETDTIVAAGGGNPLYLLALAHAMNADDAGTVTAGGDIRDQLRAALLSDVDSVSANAQLLARSAAVVGDPFDPDVVIEVSGLDRPAALVALDELHHRDVIRPESEKLLRFRHPLLRRMIYDEAPPGWRRAAHRSAIVALRWRGSSIMAEAAHLERCAGIGDTDAAEVLFQAAEIAGPRAPASAARWLRGGLALIPETASTAPAWLAHRVRLARYLVLAGQFAEAQDVLREIAGQLPIAPDPRRVEVIVLQATVDRLLGNHNDGRRRLVKEMAQSIPDTLPFAELALELATVELMEGTVSAHTVALAEQAHRIVAGSADTAIAAGAHGVAATAGHLLGELDPAIVHCDEAAEALDALTDHELGGRLDACIWTGWAEISLSRYLTGIAHFDRGIELARHSGQAHLLDGRALGLRWLGRLPAARADADDAVDIARLCRSDELLALAMATRAWITLVTTDAAAAQAEAESVVQLAGPDTGWWATMAGFVAATAQAETGEPGSAGSRLLIVGGGADLPRVDPLGRPAWYELLVRAALADGDHGRAREWAALAEATADDRMPVMAGLATLAKAESAREDNPTAERSARRAMELFGTAGTPIEQGRAALVLARSLAAGGRVTAASKVIMRAAEGFAACGATRLHDDARRRLDELGSTKGQTALSRRELEVTELVSRGLTNRQIAEQLHVTEKTVETHLSRIFTKLGLSSRAALAAWAVESRT